MTIADSGFMMENGVNCLPLPPEEEHRIITELTNRSEANLKEGNLYYVISNRLVFSFYLFPFKMYFPFLDSLNFWVAL